LIRDTTYSGTPENPLRAAAQGARVEVCEVLDAFQRRKSMSRKLEWKFEVPNPFVLLIPEEAEKFAPWSPTDQINGVRESTRNRRTGNGKSETGRPA
jgi:hypothetical protein